MQHALVFFCVIVDLKNFNWYNVIQQIKKSPRLKCRSQSATAKIAATKWVQNPLCHRDFSAVTAIFPRKVTYATKKSLTVNEA